MKYTVITGASSGIGYATALAVAERGKHLVVGVRREGNLESVKELDHVTLWIRYSVKKRSKLKRAIL